MSTDSDDGLFRAEVAKALGAISRSLEIMQANLFITRAVVDLLSEHNFLPISDVQQRALGLAYEASISPSTVDMLQQILKESDAKLPSILQ